MSMCNVLAHVCMCLCMFIIMQAEIRRLAARRATRLHSTKALSSELDAIRSFARAPCPTVADCSAKRRLLTGQDKVSNAASVVITIVAMVAVVGTL